MKKKAAIWEYFENLPVGEVINKKGLAYLKRLGYIWDYSKWGYLEDLMIYSAPEGEYGRFSDLMYVFKYGNAKEAEQLHNAKYERWRQTTATTDMTRDEVWEKFGRGNYFTLNGISFRTEYFDGCFNAYLVKSGPANGAEVKHRMAFPGGVI